MTTPTPAPAQPGTTTGDNLDHWWCCDPDRALCGADLTDATEDDSIDPNCVVCEDLIDVPCRTGCTGWEAR
jgi:hypothetical protein